MNELDDFSPFTPDENPVECVGPSRRKDYSGMVDVAFVAIEDDVAWQDLGPRDLRVSIVEQYVVDISI